ncbi:MAG: NAD(P)H-dependent oxidoreductase subunit E, partial [Deltaproteobacteria bacterium]
MVISAATRAKIDREIGKYPERRGALLPALHLVQSERGHIDRETAAELAEIFELRAVDVMEVVSFYNMFYDSPQGRHHVYVCTNLPCSLRGARHLLRTLEAHLGIRAG